MSQHYDQNEMLLEEIDIMQRRVCLIFKAVIFKTAFDNCSIIESALPTTTLNVITVII